jgi:hypothetical protein
MTTGIYFLVDGGTWRNFDQFRSGEEQTAQCNLNSLGQFHFST